MSWERPVPLIGDVTSAAERHLDPTGWAFPAVERDALDAVVAARRDVRRFRPDDIDHALVDQLLAAAHQAPSVGHSQPWRFIVVRDPQTRDTAAWLADQQRLTQAAQLDETSARQLLDLQLEGIREAPVGIVVCCDRRTDAAGILGRATFPDADMWSCSCAIQNLWLAARARGLGVGWVTLFRPADLTSLLGVPDGVETLGWLCIGYPDERQQGPGLERHGWSSRGPLGELVMTDRWNDAQPPAPPRSRIAAPTAASVVAARDATDRFLTPSGSLGVLDRALDRVIANLGSQITRATLVIVGGDHPVADLGVSPYPRTVTASVLDAATGGASMGAAAAAASQLACEVIDAGSSTGDLASNDAMTTSHTEALIDHGTRAGRRLGTDQLVVVGEVGVGNTTVAAVLSAALLGIDATGVVGLGSGADSAMIRRKQDVVAAALKRWRNLRRRADDAVDLLRTLGGPEFAVICGIVVGVAECGGVVVLDGLATSVAAAVACTMSPVASSHLIAGQRSNEIAHPLVLRHLGLEPVLDLRLRAGEGVGAVLATRLLLDGLQIRRTTARTDEPRLHLASAQHDPQ